MEDLIKRSNNYSPSAIITIFNNSINVGEEKKIIDIEGIYLRQNSREYNDYYYDRIKDNLSDKNLTLVIHKKLRNSLEDNYGYIFSGYLNRRIIENGNIQINFCVTKILSGSVQQNEKSEIKAISIRNKKALKDYKNFALIIEKKLLIGDKPILALILGNNAVVKDDIFNAIGKDINNYIIDEYRINLSSKEDLIKKVSEIDKSRKYDAVMIARGGGSGLEIFNNIDLIEYLGTINTLLVSAIGHAEDNTYLQTIADCYFDTPTALGNYLNNTSQKIIRIYSNFNAEINSEIVIKKNLENEIKELSLDSLKKDADLNNLNSKLNNKSKELLDLKRTQIIKIGIIIIIAIIILTLK